MVSTGATGPLGGTLSADWRTQLPLLPRVALLGGTALTGWLLESVRRVLGMGYVAKDAQTPLARAQQSWAGAKAALQVPGQQELYYENPQTPMLAAVWPFGQALGAALDLAKATGDYRTVNAQMRTLSLYEQGGAYSPEALRVSSRTDRYWDDNAWLGLDFMQGYAQTKNPQFLQKAEALFPFMEKGLTANGGLYWKENALPMSRSTCAQGPGIEYALRLYQATKDPKYLRFAQNLDGFLNGKDAPLRSPEGLYYDNVDKNGQVDRAIYSYNQGSPVGADVLFYKVTGDKSYLERAQRTARAALDYFSQDDRLWREAPAFNAILFRNLLSLDQVAPDPRYRQALDAYLERVWTQARDPRTGLFDRGGIGFYGSSPNGNLLDQSALVQLFALQSLPTSGLGVVA